MIQLSVSEKQIFLNTIEMNAKETQKFELQADNECAWYKFDHQFINVELIHMIHYLRLQRLLLRLFDPDLPLPLELLLSRDLLLSLESDLERDLLSLDLDLDLLLSRLSLRDRRRSLLRLLLRLRQDVSKHLI